LLIAAFHVEEPCLPAGLFGSTQGKDLSPKVQFFAFDREAPSSARGAVRRASFAAEAPEKFM
jgi:hypothetical protein